MKNNETFNTINMMNETPSVKQIKNDFFKSFDIVRDVISHDEYWSILFLLSTYKDNVAFKYLNFQSNLLTNSSNLDIDLIEKYDQVFEVVEPIINRIGEQKLYQLIEVFHSFDTAFLNDNFSQLFEVLLQDINLYQGKFSDTVSQPKELTEFMCQLAQFENAKSIYNPFSGYASFGLSLHEGQQFFGQEINRKTWAIGQLLLLANKTDDNILIKNEDVFDNWPNEKQQFDLIISHPPFISLRDTESSGIWINKYVSPVQFLVENGINKLNQNGKMILVVPNHFLSNQGGSKQIIQNLLEKDLIDTIISFPGWVSSGTGISISIVLLNKKKKYSQQIKFVDATSVVNNNSKKINHIQLLKDIIDNNSQIVRNIHADKIREYDYNLEAKRYFLEEIKGIKLSDVLTRIKSPNSVDYKTGKFVKIKHLSTNENQKYLDLDLVDEIILPKVYQIIESDCLLISLRFLHLKPTFFEFKGEPIFISNDIAAFKINPNYKSELLYEQLNNETTIKQINCLRSQNVIASLKISDFLNVKIKKPSITIPIQRVLSQVPDNVKTQMYESIFENYKTKIREQQIKINDLETRLELPNVKLRHTISAPFDNIRFFFDELTNFILRDSKNGFSCDTNLFEDSQVTINDVLNIIKNDLSFISKEFDNSQKNEDLVNKIEESINIIEFIGKYVSTNKRKNIKIEFDETNIFDLDGFLEIKGTESDMKNLIDNLLNNAINHAFDDSKNYNRFLIELEVKDDILIMYLSNTGKPFPSGFDKTKYILQGSKVESKGDGYGGYLINEITQNMDGTFDYVSNLKSSIFTTIFTFKFPILNITKYEV